MPCLSGSASIREAVVKIYSVSNTLSYHDPWQMKGQQLSHGSGCIIKGNRILTSAHVVTDSIFIQVRRAGDANKYSAKVEAIDYESDLAILRVDNNSFFANIKPIFLGDLAEVQDKVAVYGFPDGGDKLSITEGVVSRIDHIEYAYSGAMLLTCQIDAPINTGNSGGPVIFENKIVGVAFQGMGGSYENIGYMIPTPIIRHFLKDIEDGQVNGFPTLGILMQKLENPEMRSYYQLNGRDNGILVNKVYVHSPCHDALEPGDIILEINDIEIAKDGTIEFRKGQRTFFGYILQKKQLGETLRLKILRKGKEKEVSIVLDVPQEANRLIPFEHEKKPRYYIFGGLVFEPLTLNYLQEFGTGFDWASFAPVAMVDYYLNGEMNDQREEIVFLTKVLADSSNVGFHDFMDIIITEVEGVQVKSVKQLAQIIEANTKKYLTIKTKNALEITLEMDLSRQQSENILKKHQISAKRSKTL